MCDEESGYVFWNETSQCYRLYTQGPCPKDAWLIPGEDTSDVYCECKTGFYFAPESYSCKESPVIETIGLLSYLRKTSPAEAEEAPPKTERTRATSRYVAQRRRKVAGGESVDWSEGRSGGSVARTRYQSGRKTAGVSVGRSEGRTRYQSGASVGRSGAERVQSFEGIFVRPGHTGTAKRNVVGAGPDYTWLEQEVLPRAEPLKTQW